MVAAGWASRCSMNAAISRIGPSRLLLITASAEARKPSGLCQSSACMIPAIGLSTSRSGCRASACSAAAAMLAGSVVSMATESRPGCSAVRCPSRSVRRPPMMTVLPRACSASASARPMPLVEPGMKMVFPEISMPSAWPGQPRSGRERLSGDRRSLAGHRPGPDNGGMDRAALAGFLPPRGEAWHPADVGLPAGVRRRAPGLRREEVAALALMSTDYYTRLEQQRGPQPSSQMLASLARALRLTRDERDYLFRVAGHNPPSPATAASHVAPALLRVLDRLDDPPAMVLSSLGEVLVQNRMAVVAV